jgi:hypothetical protein
MLGFFLLLERRLASVEELHSILLWFVSPTVPRFTHCRVYEITLRNSTRGRTPSDVWSDVAGTSTLQHTHQANKDRLYDPGWIRTLTPSKRTAADPTLESVATGIDFRWISLFIQLDKYCFQCSTPLSVTELLFRCTGVQVYRCTSVQVYR